MFPDKILVFITKSLRYPYFVNYEMRSPSFNECDLNRLITCRNSFLLCSDNILPNGILHKLISYVT